MRKISVTHSLLILFTGAMLSACSMQGYQKIEEMSLPRYQEGTPVMSEMEVVCRAQVLVEPEDEHPPLEFMVTYDRIWDVTVYPTSPRIPRKYPKEKWCENGVSTQVITHTGLGTLYTRLAPEGRYDTRLRYNMDPSKGAVRVWTLPRVEIDGLNARATMITFLPMIIEGHKLPTYSWFSNGKYTTDPHTSKKAITLNERTWQYYQYEFIVGRDIPEHDGYKAGETMFEELYTTQIGDYMFAVVGAYDSGLATHAPDWLNQRREFLREWLETYEFVPLNKNAE
jgi:hypothetical protein